MKNYDDLNESDKLRLESKINQAVLDLVIDADTASIVESTINEFSKKARIVAKDIIDRNRD